MGSPAYDRARSSSPLHQAVEVSGFIRFEAVGMTYATASGSVEALRDISFAVGRGELVALVGPSGCGKSTLLRIVAGLRPPTRGAVRVDEAPVTGPLPSVGMVFQAPVLLRWRRLLDNVLLPADLAGLPRARYRERAMTLLRITGLGDFADKHPSELSGGMQQRASLCRALLLDPPILLMDEPFGALDALTRDDMNLELLRVWGESALAKPSGGRVAGGETGCARRPVEGEPAGGRVAGGGAASARRADEGAPGARKTILFVTHSIAEAVFLADRVVVMTARPGRVARVVNVGLPRPRTAEVRGAPEFGRLTLEVQEALGTRGSGAGRAG